MRAKIRALISAAAFFALCACGGEAVPAQTVDPDEGMVQVESGFGTKMWVELYEDVPASTFEPSDFLRSGGFINYAGGEFEALRGIDVSEHQKTINWRSVASEGVDFAMIRAGYRGYSQGGLYEDEYFSQNISGALDNRLEVGVYFFSQAVTPEEAVEEAEYLLELIRGYDVTLPVVFDWENIEGDDARTDGLGGTELTDCAIAFCQRIRQAGFEPAIYAYRYLAYFRYELPRLTDYTLWIGAIGDSPDFYYSHNIWQYSAEGRVSGVDGPVDLNLLFREKQPPAAEAEVPRDTAVAPAPTPDKDNAAVSGNVSVLLKQGSQSPVSFPSGKIRVLIKQHPVVV